MVTLKDVMRSINIKIKTLFPDKILLSTDVKEGVERACFYVSFVDVNTYPINSTHMQREIDVTIYYFPSDRNKYRLELLEVQDIVETEFIGKLEVKDDFSVMIESIDSEVDDGVLECSFKIEYIEFKPDKADALLNEIDNLTFGFKP